MIRNIPQTKSYSQGFRLYVILYFIFLFAPLAITGVLAFNDSMFPSLPWKGFTLEWFTGHTLERTVIFNDQINLDSIWVSFKVAFFVSLFSTFVGTMGAFLFEQEDFPFKQLLFFLMLAPLVIPGVILGISILLFSNTLGLFFETHFGLDVGLFRPSILGAMAVSFLMSFENFNTTLFLVGSQATLPINLYLQVRDGSTPVINAISVLMIGGTSLLALANLYFSKQER